MSGMKERAIADALAIWNGQKKNKIDRTTLISTFKKKVFGQDKTIEQFVHLYAEHQRKISTGSATMPLFCLLIGPPGLGKTFFCKVAAEVLFGSTESLVEYNFANAPKTTGELQRELFGGNRNLVGAGPGLITAPLATNPNQVVLLDECHLAHSEIWSFFTSISQGYLNDTYMQRKIPVIPSVFLAASNQSYDDILRQDDQIRASLDNNLNVQAEITTRKNVIVPFLVNKDIIRPEFGARVAGVFVFRHLAPNDGYDCLLSAIKIAAESHGVNVKENDGLKRVLQAGLVDSFEAGSNPRTPYVNGRKLVDTFFAGHVAPSLQNAVDELQYANDSSVTTVSLDWDEQTGQAIVLHEPPAGNPDPCA